jgi:hypothetical protein
MEFEFDSKSLRFDKVLSELDKLVLDFVGLLDLSNVRYVIVSGYVAILLGRSRTTEDIDIFIERLSSKSFTGFFKLLEEHNYWIINSDSCEDALDVLNNSLAIRIAKKGEAVPNFEIKFAKKDADFLSLNDPMKVTLNNHKLLMSPLEVQIPFKFFLGSEKDIEDATHIYELFKDKLDRKLMGNVARNLKVTDTMIEYGML